MRRLHKPPRFTKQTVFHSRRESLKKYYLCSANSKEMNSKEFHINRVEQLSEVSEYLMSLREEADIIAFYG